MRWRCSSMPMFQYVCGKCSREFEIRRPRIDARKKAECPDCGSESKRRVSEVFSKRKH